MAIVPRLIVLLQTNLTPVQPTLTDATQNRCLSSIPLGIQDAEDDLNFETRIFSLLDGQFDCVTNIPTNKSFIKSVERWLALRH